MIEVEFRKLVIPALAREIAGLRVWPQNTGKIVIPKTQRSAQRAFTAGPPDGAADISGILSPEGCRFELELKSPTAVYTHEQKLFGAAIRNLGGIHLMFRMGSTDGIAELPRCVDAVRLAVKEWRACTGATPAQAIARRTRGLRNRI